MLLGMKLKNVIIAMAVAVGLSGCGTLAVYTEEGLQYASDEWHAEYHQRLDYCRERHEPETPGAEECFGDYYDADGEVETAVRLAVGLLRGYWLARAQGKHPDWRRVARDLKVIFEDLPPEAKKYFDRVKGIR